MAERVQLVANHLATEYPFSNRANLTTPFISEPLSYLSLESLIPPEINEKRIRLRAVLDQEIAPVINQYYERAEFPTELVGKLRGLDLCGFPEAVAGVRQQRLLEFVMVIYELARVDTSLATFVLVSFGLAAKTIYLL